MTMVKPGKKTSKGRQKIEIRYIDDKAKRHVALCKRKGGILKKCSELHLLCGAHDAVIIFSKKEEQAQPQGDGEPPAPTAGGRSSRAGNVFAMGTPSVDHVVRCFAPLPGDEMGVLLPAGADREAKALVKAGKDRMSAVVEKVQQAAGRRFWWEADVEALGEAELPDFARALQRVRENVQRVADKQRASAPPAVAAAPWHP
ncbi:hypothetical protein PVAP13_4NG227300 [Panicum virgatum]|uniref:MADS-box domain-containing protein n=1 Tax=Panicum virgatum TaxID=38727 RepID=A0A8T0T7R0_PANVG|nr:hypothetical protein PVAP13_4NG227300 [Panicum virgatum]